MKKSKKIIFMVLIIVVVGVISYFYINSKNTSENEVYSIKNKKFYLYEEETGREEDYRGIKLLEYDNSADEYAEIYYILYDYTTEPSIYYTLEITDKSNNSLLIDGAKEQKVIGGMISSVKIKKIGLEEKIVVSVYEKYEEANSIEDSAQIQIDLSKDLEEKNKIDQFTNVKTANLGGVEFDYIDSEYVYFGTTSHAYSDKLFGENSSIPIKAQYGNYLMQEEHIDIHYDKNVNNLSLNEAFESLKVINENLGQYGLSDTYGLGIYDEQGEYIDTLIVNFEEMIKICKGETIEKNGTQYNKRLFFDEYATIGMYKDAEVEIGNKFKAIKYHFEYNEDSEKYMFIYGDNIYNITVPKNERTLEIVNKFLESLEIAK